MFDDCCAQSSNGGKCLFRGNRSTDHACIGMGWLSRELEVFASDQIVELNIASDRKVTTTTASGQKFESTLNIPRDWLGNNVDLSPQTLKADLGRHMVGFNMNLNSPTLLQEVISEPIPIIAMSCADGRTMTCPIDPMFSWITWHVDGSAGNPDCISNGSFQVVRKSFTFDMDVCSTQDSSTVTELRKLVTLRPEALEYHFDNLIHKDIPNSVECTCKYALEKKTEVVAVAKGRKAKVYKASAWADDLELYISRTTANSQGKERFELKANTSLDRIQMQSCWTDQIEIDDDVSELKGNELPLLRSAKLSTSAELGQTPAQLDITDFEFEFLKVLKLDISNGVGQYGLREQTLSMNAFTASTGFLYFECIIRVCHANAPSRCQTRRLKAAEARAPRRAQAESSDSAGEDQTPAVVLNDEGKAEHKWPTGPGSSLTVEQTKVTEPSASVEQTKVTTSKDSPDMHVDPTGTPTGTDTEPSSAHVVCPLVGILSLMMLA